MFREVGDAFKASWYPALTRYTNKGHINCAVRVLRFSQSAIVRILRSVPLVKIHAPKVDGKAIRDVLPRDTYLIPTKRINFCFVKSATPVSVSTVLPA